MVRLPAKLKDIVENADVANTIVISDANSDSENMILIVPSESVWTVLLARPKRMLSFLLVKVAGQKIVLAMGTAVGYVRANVDANETEIVPA